MTEIIVGDEDCTPTKVYNALYNPNTAGILAKKWGEVALNLGIPGNIIHQTKIDNNDGKKTTMEVYITILENWVVANGKLASLNNLIHIFEKEMTDLKLFVDALRKLQTDIINQRADKAKVTTSNNQVQADANSSGPATASVKMKQYEISLGSISVETLITSFGVYLSDATFDNNDITNIINQVLLLGHFDNAAHIVELAQNARRQTGRERFIELMNYVQQNYSQNLKSAQVLEVFNLLINLKRRPQFSERIRDYIRAELPQIQITEIPPNPDMS